MVRDQASPLIGTVVNGISVVVRLAGANGVSKLPESVAGHTRGGDRGDLPWSLDRAVVGWRAVYYLEIWVSFFLLLGFFVELFCVWLVTYILQRSRACSRQRRPLRGRLPTWRQCRIQRSL